MTEFNTIIRPDFLYWAHQGLWGILADNPKWTKDRAAALLQKRYPNKIRGTNIPTCFACRSRSMLLYNRLVKPRACPLYCPLDWGLNRNCFDADAAYTLWMEAKSSQQWDLVAKYAVQMKNLPLKNNVHQYYNVKESCND